MEILRIKENSKSDIELPGVLYKVEKNEEGKLEHVYYIKSTFSEYVLARGSSILEAKRYVNVMLMRWELTAKSLPAFIEDRIVLEERNMMYSVRVAELKKIVGDRLPETAFKFCRSSYLHGYNTLNIFNLDDFLQSYYQEGESMKDVIHRMFGERAVELVELLI